MLERLAVYFSVKKGFRMSNSTVPIKEFRLELSDLTYTGHDLVRPESVLAQPTLLPTSAWAKFRSYTLMGMLKTC
jgi:hypothetical protein